ncbi:MAG: hypothetical protein V1660_02980 [archaeon]
MAKGGGGIKNKNKFVKNKLARNILSALAVAFFGFILLIVTFLFDAVFQGIIRRLIMPFILPESLEGPNFFLPGLFHGSFVVLILLISIPIFRSKLRVLYKAIYMTVPLAVVLATIGIFFYQWFVIPYLLGALICLGLLYYFYRTKKPWLYYYTVILVSLILGIFTLTGGEI